MEALSNLLGNTLALFIVCAFVAVVLFFEGLYMLWSASRSPEVKKIERRLHALSAGAIDSSEASIIKERLLRGSPGMDRLMARAPRLRQLDRVLEQSGLTMSVGQMLGLTAFAGIGTGLLLKLLSIPTIVVFGIALATASIPFVYVTQKRRARLRRLEQQLPEALDLIGRALRAGHAFGTGLAMVGEEMTDPIASEFRITHDEVNYGVAMQQALLNLAIRVPCTDVRYFIIAVLIQRESGGNLTEVLGNLSTLMRERFKLLEKVRVLAAEGKLSAWILGLLPFGLATIINLINPKFMQVLWTDPMGLNMVYSALFMMSVGVLWMRKIIRIHV